MSSDDLATLSRRDKLRGTLLIVILIAASLWFSAHFLQPAPPRQIVLASGADFGIYHQFARALQEILARDGVRRGTHDRRAPPKTRACCRIPKSGVDVAFMQGGS